MNYYKEWGLIDNPFNTFPLTPDEDGEVLLVERQKEMKQIKLQLCSSNNLITVEGANGIGKTSLINVATFELFREYLISNNGEFFIPCDICFQLTADKNIEDFVDEVMMAIAQTLIKRAKILKDKGYIFNNNKQIDKWLNSPILSTYNGNVSSIIAGIGLGKTSETNTSIGYLRSGFKVQVINWLEQIFPYSTHRKSGIVCILDNLELLQTSSNARKQVEALRDTLFNYTGIRWVLCGSLGIVKSVASSSD